MKTGFWLFITFLGGMLFLWIGWHLWVDHANLHSLINIEAQRQTQQQLEQQRKPIVP